MPNDLLELASAWASTLRAAAVAVLLLAVPFGAAAADERDTCLAAAAKASELSAEGTRLRDACLAFVAPEGLSDEDHDLAVDEACKPARDACGQVSPWDAIEACELAAQSGQLGGEAIAEVDQASGVLRTFSENVCPPQ